MSAFDLFSWSDLLGTSGILTGLAAAAFAVKRIFFGVGRSAGLADEQSVHSAVAELTAAITLLKEENAESIKELTEKISEMSLRVAAVEYQVAPNHGGSLRDKVVRAETRMDIVMDHLKL